MATASGWYTQVMLDTMDPSQVVLDLTLATYKIALINSTGFTAGNFDTDLSWSNTNEVSGTGWATGGILLSAAASGASATPTLTISPTGTMMWDMLDLSVASTTLTNARACRFYADPVTTPYADPLILMVNFGADYSTTNGTFGIQWASTGVGTVDWTP